jgi:hypothetical protein
MTDVASDEFRAVMHGLSAPDARRIRLDWKLGSSGARITDAESDELNRRLRERKINIPPLLSELRRRTDQQHWKFKERREREKAAKKEAKRR